MSLCPVIQTNLCFKAQQQYRTEKSYTNRNIQRLMITAGGCGRADTAILRMTWFLRNAVNAIGYAKSVNVLRKSVIRACGAHAT